MKKLFTFLFLVAALGASAQTTLLNYWNFNLSDTSAWRTPTDSKVAGARLDYYGAYADYVTDAPDTTNSRDENGPAPGFALRLRSTYGAFIMTLPTTGYQGIVVKYGLFKSGSGSGINTITYTTDGVKWDSAGLIITDGALAPTTGLGTYSVNAVGAPLDLITLDFSNISGVNNNPLFQVQINFDNTAKGNDRYDNLSIEGTPATLAVSLQSFSGAIVNKNAKLVWATTSEVDAKSFSIEASTDRKNFSEIGSVDAKNVKGTNSYEFETAAPTATTYYRLKMIDKNGSFTYSSIVALNASVSVKKLTAFPNPAVNSITLSHEQAIAGALIKILSVDGKTVLATAVKIGAIQTSIDVSKLAKGSYIVSFENNGQKTITQFIK